MNRSPAPDADSSTLPEAAGCWRFGSAQFDERIQLLTIRGVAVTPPKKCLLVLRALLNHAGEVVTKDELLETCWPGRVLSDTVLTTTLSRLREALSDTDQTLIETVKGYGYRLAVPVSFEGPAPSQAPRLGLRAGDHPPGRPEWQLVKALGAGGHGDVWLGRDANGAQRVFKFAIERQMVASLKREVAISRLLHDAVGGEGFISLLDWDFERQPGFIAMEHVAGGNLEQWAQAQGGLGNLSLTLRLDLAAQCAEALGAAHAVGVLHKDLKPANVLVDQIDGNPRLRLCDFGSGTVLDRERLRRYALTQAGLTQVDSSSGTPMYMAPEVLGGQTPTERSDVYALGVLLFQLVIGDFRRPLAAGWEAEIPDELLREDIALTATGDPLRRLADAAELARRLRNLPSRRGKRLLEQRDSLLAAALQTQLERHRQRRPLLIGIGLVMAGGLVAASVLSWRLRTALGEARHQAEVATAVNDFLQKDLLAGADPNQAGKPDPSMREVLKTADARISERFAEQPLQEGAVRTTLGTVWHLIGNDPDAERDLRRAIEVLEPLGDAARLDTARAHLALGRNLSIRSIDEYAVHLDRAEALAAQGSDLASWKVGAQVRLARARIHDWSGETPQALAILDPLYKDIVARLPPDDPFRVKTGIEYVSIVEHSGRHAEALTAGRELLPYLERGRARNQGEAADLRRLIASILLATKQLPEAEAEAQRALRDFSATLGATNPETLSTAKLIALIQIRSGRVDEGIKALRALLQPTRDTQGELGYSVNLTAVLADAVIEAGQWQTAESDARVALAEAQSVSPDRPELAALATTQLAYALAKLGRRDEAATLFERVMPLIRERMAATKHEAYIRANRRYEEFVATP